MPGQAAGDDPGFIAPMLATAAAGLPPDAYEFVAEVKWDGPRPASPWPAGGSGLVPERPRHHRGLSRARRARRGGRAPEPGAGRGDRRLVRSAAGLHRAAAADARQPARCRAARRGAGHANHLRRAALSPRGPHRPPVRAAPRPAGGSRPPGARRRAGAARVPGRCRGAAGGYPRPGPGGDRAQASRVAVPPGPAHPEWVKIRNIRAAEVRVGGWLPGTGGRRNMAGSVLMGLPRPGALEFAGTVGSGLSVAEPRELTALLEAVEQPVSPFTGPLPAAVARQARWARPVLAAEVTYLERTPFGRLRQPVSRGLSRG